MSNYNTNMSALEYGESSKEYNDWRLAMSNLTDELIDESKVNGEFVKKRQVKKNLEGGFRINNYNINMSDGLVADYYQLMRTHFEGYKELYKEWYLLNLIMSMGRDLGIDGSNEFNSRIKIILDKLKGEQEKQVKENTNVLEDTNLPICLINLILEYIFYEFKKYKLS